MSDGDASPTPVHGDAAMGVLVIGAFVVAALLLVVATSRARHRAPEPFAVPASATRSLP